MEEQGRKETDLRKGGSKEPDGEYSLRLAWIEAFTAVALTRRGPYWKLSEPLGRLRDLLAERRIDPSGPALGIFYDDPGTTPSEHTRYTLAYPIEDDAAPAAAAALQRDPLPPEFGDESVEVRHVPASRVALLEYEGPAAHSGEAYATLSSSLARMGYAVAGPPREMYLAEPGTLSGGQIHVIIQQPVVGRER